MLRAKARSRRRNGSSLDQKRCHAVTGSPRSLAIAFNSDVQDELSPEHIAAGLPGTADLMVLVANSWWRLA